MERIGDKDSSEGHPSRLRVREPPQLPYFSRGSCPIRYCHMGTDASKCSVQPLVLSIRRYTCPPFRLEKAANALTSPGSHCPSLWFTSCKLTISTLPNQLIDHPNSQRKPPSSVRIVPRIIPYTRRSYFSASTECRFPTQRKCRCETMSKVFEEPSIEGQTRGLPVQQPRKFCPVAAPKMVSDSPFAAICPPTSSSFPMRAWQHLFPPPTGPTKR